MKLIPDQSRRVEEKNILERQGFIVVEITSAPFALTHSRSSATGPGALKV
jgi:hypothetical protein